MRWLLVSFGGESHAASSVDHFELRLQPVPRSEGDVPVEAVAEVLHRHHALVQDWDVVVRLCARHTIGSEAFA